MTLQACGKKGIMANMVEAYPGVNLDLDSTDGLTGVKIRAQARRSWSQPSNSGTS